MGEGDGTDAIDIGQDAFADVGEEAMNVGGGDRGDASQSIFDADAIAKEKEEAEEGDDGADDEGDEIGEEVSAEGEDGAAKGLEALEEGGADLLFGFGGFDAEPEDGAVEQVGGPLRPAPAGGAFIRGQIVELAGLAEEGGTDAEGGEGDEQDDEEDGEASRQAGSANGALDAVVEGVKKNRERDGGDQWHQEGPKDSEGNGERGGTQAEKAGVLNTF